MTYVVIDSCIKCKYTDCVDVCPVDAFREGENFLAIDPDECIDCTLCVPECPVDAIFAEDDVPEEQRYYIDLNAELAKQWKMQALICGSKTLPPARSSRNGLATTRAGGKSSRNGISPNSKATASKSGS